MLSVFLVLHAFLTLEFEYFDGVVEFSMVALVSKGFYTQFLIKCFPRSTSSSVC